MVRMVDVDAKYQAAIRHCLILFQIGNKFVAASFPVCSSRQYHVAALILVIKLSTKLEFFGSLELLRSQFLITK